MVVLFLLLLLLVMMVAFLNLQNKFIIHRMIHLNHKCGQTQAPYSGSAGGRVLWRHQKIVKTFTISITDRFGFLLKKKKF